MIRLSTNEHDELVSMVAEYIQSTMAIDAGEAWDMIEEYMLDMEDGLEEKFKES